MTMKPIYIITLLLFTTLVARGTLQTVTLGPDTQGNVLSSIEYNTFYSEVYMVRPGTTLEVYDLSFQHLRTIPLIGGNSEGYRDAVRDQGSGNFFITNISSNTIDRFDSSGNFQSSIATGSVKGIAYRPDTGTLLTVQSPGTPVIDEYSPNGNLLNSFTLLQHGADGLGLTYDSANQRIFLGSQSNFIKTYDLSGNLLETVIDSSHPDRPQAFGIIGEGMSFDSVDQTLFWTGHGGEASWNQTIFMYYFPGPDYQVNCFQPVTSYITNTNQVDHSVAIDEDTMVVGGSGIYERNQGGADNWGLVKQLTGGTRVSISEDTILAGGVIYERNQGGTDNWGLVKSLSSGSISGDTILAGGAIYERNQGGMNNWGLVKSGLPNGCLSGDTIVVGGSESADIFERNQGGANNWGFVKTITASNSKGNDRFGESVSISGDIIAVTAIFTDPRADLHVFNDYASGSAYIFERNRGGANNWGEVKEISAITFSFEQEFGNSISVDGDTIVVGAVRDMDNYGGFGGAYVFQRNQGGTDNWGEVDKLMGCCPLFPFAFGFGRSVAHSDNTVVVGSQNGVTVFQSVCSNNTTPTAVAGDDQSIRAGDTVNLDGSDSLDDNTAQLDLEYAWSFSSVPAGSSATLLGADTVTPSFVADVAGSYTVELVVTDEGGLASDPDEVIVSSDNLAPTAVATSLFNIYIVGDTANLNGTGSSDPEMDPFTYNWSLTSAPAGSTTLIQNFTSENASLVLDVRGSYETTLTVSDEIGPGTPASLILVATTAEEYAEIQIMNASDMIGSLLPGQLDAIGHQTALGNYLQKAISDIQSGNIGKAITWIEKTLERTDGCVLRGSSDGNGNGMDWVTDCAVQQDLYALLTDAIDALSP